MGNRPIRSETREIIANTHVTSTFQVVQRVNEPSFMRFMRFKGQLNSELSLRSLTITTRNWKYGRNERRLAFNYHSSTTRLRYAEVNSYFLNTVIFFCRMRERLFLTQRSQFLNILKSNYIFSPLDHAYNTRASSHGEG